MISVCIATYNGAKYIREQLESILPQLQLDDEVIVSDDGSTDATLNEVRALQSPLIRIVQGPGRHTPIYNFEHVLRQAKGDYIFLSDQDDVWTADKVQVMMQALRRSTLVVSDCAVTDSQLKVIAPSFYDVVRKQEGRWYNLLVRNCYLGCCMAFRREVLAKALPFPANIPMHDIWLGNVAAFYYDVEFIPQVLMSYRRHGANASSTSDPSRYSLWRKILFRLRVAVGLVGLMGRRNRRNHSAL